MNERKCIKSITLKGYLKKYAATLPDAKLPDDYKRQLHKYCDGIKIDGIKIRITKGPIYDSKILNAWSFSKRKITINENWAKPILFHNDERMDQSFRMTIGHELTHKNGEYHKYKRDHKSNMLIDWTREARADFGGVYKMLNGDRISGIEAIKYKSEWDMRTPSEREDDENDGTHPFTYLRIEYLEKYDFDQNLIHRIAEDIGGCNIEIIKTLCDFYKDDKIQLSPPPMK